jgi:hypothetical protein
METWIAILIGAVGTWVIAIIAIWDKFLSSRFLRPTLHIGTGEFSGTPARHRTGQSARYYLVPVENLRRPFSQAHEVQLVLTRLEKSGGSGRSVTPKLLEIILLMALRLLWSIWVLRIVVGRLAIHAAQISNSVGGENWEAAPIALSMLPSLSSAPDARSVAVALKFEGMAMRTSRVESRSIELFRSRSALTQSPQARWPVQLPA